MPLPEEGIAQPEERVIRQLVAALIFEKQLATHWQKAPEGDYLHWRLESIEYRCQAQIGAFNRVRIRAASVQEYVGEQAWQIADLGRLVAALSITLPATYPATASQAIAPKMRSQLLDELAQTVQLCDWNWQRLLMPDSRRQLDFVQLVGTLDEGHAYHPGFKARSGFSIEDHQSYSPEAGAKFQLVWLAVARSQLRQSLPLADTGFWLQELGAKTWNLLSHRLAHLGGNWHDYGLLPLHPWQWQQLRHQQLAQGLAQGHYYFLDGAGDHYLASQSLGTLLNVDQPHQASLKLALDVVTPGFARRLPPDAVCHAPAIGHWLQEVVALDPLFSERYPLTLLADYAGIKVNHLNDEQLVDEHLADEQSVIERRGLLTASWRPSIHSVLAPGEQAVPFNALMLLEQDGRPFIDDWLAQYGQLTWLQQLLEVAILPVWHLLVAHGIALAAHSHNMMLVHDNGWPVRLVLCDVHDSLAYVPDWLTAPERLPDFMMTNGYHSAYKSKSPYAVPSTEQLRQWVMDHLLVFNVSELSYLFEHYYQLPERRFWSLLAARLDTYAAEHQLQTRQRALGHDASQLYTASPLTRQLSGGREAHQHLIDNPLCAMLWREFMDCTAQRRSTHGLVRIRGCYAAIA